MRTTRLHGFALAAFLIGATLTVARADGWLDDDPAAIWQRSPGFYEEGDRWYAILHTRPEISRVQLVGDFMDGDAGGVELTQTPDGKFWWFAGDPGSFSRPPQAGDRYHFVLTRPDGTEVRTQDPAARRVESSNLSASSLVTASSDYVWRDREWSRPGWPYYLIYQLHPLRFSDRHQDLPPLVRITEELDGDGTDDYLASSRSTAIQLLPINEFPGDVSWGYNPSFFYAVESSYGTPDQLKELVDTAHRSGKAVILDVVYNHGGSGDNILWQIAQDDIHHGTYYDGDTVWGPMVNFDNDVARHFFVQNIVYLATEFHIDGFRFDFTRPIHDPNDSNIRESGSGGGWSFLREIREKMRAIDPGILLIAEELPNTWSITSENVGDAWGDDFHGPFDAQWADAFHDSFKAVLTGAGHIDQLRNAFTEFGDSWQDAVIYTESHDEVGNVDGRIASHQARDGKGWEMSQLAAAGTILGRGVPMIFMGQEAGEHLQFGQDNSRIPPASAPDWWDDRLPISAYETDPGRQKVRAWYEKMLEIRRADLDALAWSGIEVLHLHEENGIAAFARDNGKYVTVLNLKGGSWDGYDIGVRGRYRELANTSWPLFNVGGYPEKTRGGWHAHEISDVPIPAYGTVVLLREG